MSVSSAVLSKRDCTRFHLSMNVNSLGEAVRFLTALLGCPPSKHFKDYAKFEPDDLPIVLSLEPRFSIAEPIRGTQGIGALNHVGIRFSDRSDIAVVQQRVEAAGYVTTSQDGVACCYANQTKFWVFDQDQTMWEVYVLNEDVPYRGEADVSVEAASGACRREVLALPVAGRVGAASESQESAAPRVLTFQMGDAETKIEDGEWDEIRLQGPLNEHRFAKRELELFQRCHACLAENGMLFVHALTSREALVEFDSLPGPAAVVTNVPAVGDVVKALQAAGFDEVRLTQFDSEPCFVQQGNYMHQTRITAVKVAKVEEPGQWVINRGPCGLIGNDGTVIGVGVPTLIAGRQWRAFKESSMGMLLTPLSSGSQPRGCGV